MKINPLAIFAVIVALLGAVVLAVSYPALGGLGLLGVAIVFAILALKE